MTVDPKWIRNKSDEQAAFAGCYFDEAAANRVKQFVEQYIRVPDGKGGPTKGELMQWQWENVIAPLFGWKRADGTRRFKQAYVSTPKKQGKTFLLTIILLFMLLDSGIGAECYSVATTRSQAGMIFREAKKIVKASPELAAILDPTDTSKTISFHHNAAFYTSLSAEASSAEGLNINFWIYDELHAARNRALFDALRYAGIARPNSLQVYITTAGHDRESICFEQYTYAKRVAAGEVNDSTYFSCIYEAAPDDDWKDEAVHKKCNPALGVTIPLEDFRRDFLEALHDPSKEQAFRRYRLNQWTEVSTRWIPLALWDKNGGEIIPEDYEGMECKGALDLASKTDTACFELVFANDKGGYDLIPYFWMPAENVVSRGLAHGVSYSAWHDKGFIDLTPGAAIDYETIRGKIKALGEQYNITEIAYDPWDATQLVQQLEADGFTMVPIRQGVSLSPPAKEFYRLLLGGKINHGNHPVLRWHAGNVEAKVDTHDNIKLEKPGGIKSGTKKIDGIIATVMGIDRAMRHESGGGPSVHFI